MDFRRNKFDIQPFISGDSVERVSDFCVLGVHIMEDLTLVVNTAEVVKKAQERLYFLRALRKNNILQKLLLSFYHYSIESVLTYCMCVWFASCTAAQRKAFQRVINTQEIIGCPLPSLEELHSSRCLRKVENILKDSHPLHKLLPLSGRQYGNLKTRTDRLKNCFYPIAINALNAAVRSIALYGDLCNQIRMWSVSFLCLWIVFYVFIDRLFMLPF